jgi:hypothetical protein
MFVLFLNNNVVLFFFIVVSFVFFFCIIVIPFLCANVVFVVFSHVFFLGTCAFKLLLSSRFFLDIVVVSMFLMFATCKNPLFTFCKSKSRVRIFLAILIFYELSFYSIHLSFFKIYFSCFVSLVFLKVAFGTMLDFFLCFVVKDLLQNIFALEHYLAHHSCLMTKN